MRLQLTKEPTWIRLTAGLLTLAGVTACGGGGSPGDTSADAGGGAPEEFGLSLADLTVRVEDTEQLIARCVADAGFDYVAVDFVTIKEAMDSDRDPHRDCRTTPTSRSTGSGSPRSSTSRSWCSARPPEQRLPRRSAGVGPGRVPASTLGRGDRLEPRPRLEEEDFSQTGGCTLAAADEVYSAGELSGTYINPADKLVEQDPRMVDAIAAWSDCMAAEGYDYTHPDQVSDDLTQRLDAIAQGQDPATLGGPDLEALHELQGEELAVAALLASMRGGAHRTRADDGRGRALRRITHLTPASHSAEALRHRGVAAVALRCSDGPSEHRPDRSPARTPLGALTGSADDDDIGVPAVVRPQRLMAVRETGLLDTPADEAFDRLTRLARTLLRSPYAFVTVVDETRVVLEELRRHRYNRCCRPAEPDRGVVLSVRDQHRRRARRR